MSSSLLLSCEIDVNFLTSFWQHVFSLDCTTVQNGRGKCPHDPKLPFASTFTGTFQCVKFQRQSSCHGMLVLCVYKYVRARFCVCVCVCVCVYFGLCVCWVEVSSCQLSLGLWPIVDWLLWWEKFEVFFSPGLVLRGLVGVLSLLGHRHISQCVCVVTALHNLGSPRVTFCQMQYISGQIFKIAC